MTASQLSDIVATIIVMSLSGSAFIVLLLALKPLIRHRLPKSVQYLLWLITFVALLVPVSKLIAIPKAPSEIIRAPIHSVSEQNNVLEEANPLPHSDTGTESQTDTAEMPAVVPAPNPVLAVVMSSMIAYMLIALCVLSYSIFSYIRFTKKVRRHRTRPRMEELYKHVGLCGDSIAPRLYRSGLVTTPMLIGIFKPEIILPDREYTDTQIQSVLEHELIHLRRRDVLVKWLSVFACALHWFNPLVWLARREIDRICELSCDEAVIRSLDQEGKQSYGETLISVATVTKAPRAVLSTTMCEEREILKERLASIAKYQRRTWITLVLSTVMIMIAFCVVCLLGAIAIASPAGGYAAGAPEKTPMQIVLPSAAPAATPEPTPMQSVLPSAAPAATPEPTPTPSATPAPASPPAAPGEAIIFKDPIVEKVIRTMLNKPEGPVTDQDMLNVWNFKFDYTEVEAYGGEIKTIDDLRWCLNLRRVTLWETNITDISALSGTRDLVEFHCQDKLDDFTPLLGNKNLAYIQLTGVTDSFFRDLMANCSKLNKVYLYKSDISSESIRMLAENYHLSILAMNICDITDVSPFAGFTGLEYFSLEYNNIDDISALAANQNLSQYIDLSANKITDWSPLEGMRVLKTLSVRDNPVTESPALDNLEKNGCKIYR